MRGVLGEGPDAGGRHPVDLPASGLRPDLLNDGHRVEGASDHDTREVAVDPPQYAPGEGRARQFVTAVHDHAAVVAVAHRGHHALEGTAVRKCLVSGDHRNLAGSRVDKLRRTNDVWLIG